MVLNVKTKQKKKQFVYTTINMFSTCSPSPNSMINLLSYCGIVDARISTSEKDLPVESTKIKMAQKISKRHSDKN